MPEVNGQEYPYTKEGISQAQKAAKSSGKQVKYNYKRVMSSGVKSKQDISKSPCHICEMIGGWSF